MRSKARQHMRLSPPGTRRQLSEPDPGGLAACTTQ
ncbi:hypothetical protein BN432_2502 [Erwinia amylovora Ea356]|nr:hypothetical protein BN432_2502 [Erwinia amylovora Ea356]